MTTLILAFTACLIALSLPAARTRTAGVAPPAVWSSAVPPVVAVPGPWQMTCVDGLEAATELLDELEGRGAVGSELVVLGDSRFLVRWR